MLWNPLKWQAVDYLMLIIVGVLIVAFAYLVQGRYLMALYLFMGDIGVVILTVLTILFLVIYHGDGMEDDMDFPTGPK
jgi:hypothetical protein